MKKYLAILLALLATPVCAQSDVEREVSKHIAEMCYILEISPSLLDPMRPHLITREKREKEALEFVEDSARYNVAMTKARDDFFVALAQTTSLGAAKRWAEYIKNRNKYFMEAYTTANEMRVAVSLNMEQMYQLFAVLVKKHGDMAAAKRNFGWGTPQCVQARIDAQVDYIAGLDYVMDDEQRSAWSNYVKREPSYAKVVSDRIDEVDRIVSFTEKQRGFLRPVFTVQLMDLEAANRFEEGTKEYKEAMKECFSKFYRELNKVLTLEQRTKYQSATK